MDYSATIEVDTGEAVLFEQTYRDADDLFDCLERREKLEHWSYQTRKMLDGHGYYDAMFSHTFPDGVIIDVCWTYCLDDGEWFYTGSRAGDRNDIWVDFTESEDDMHEVHAPESLCGRYAYRVHSDWYFLTIQEA